jgi:NifU-like protein involved in Fe-S cluster formation
VRFSPEEDVSWEDALRDVIRKYRDGPGGLTPDWVSRSEVASERANAACGDRARLYRSPRGEVWVTATGCAICLASAELLNRIAAAVPTEELPRIARGVVDTLGAGGAAGGDLPGKPAGEPAGRSGAPSSTELAALLPPSAADDLAAFVPLRDVPGRRRCGTLPWELLLREGTREDGSDPAGPGRGA